MSRMDRRVPGWLVAHTSAGEKELHHLTAVDRDGETYNNVTVTTR
jgi:hypothetical protein